MNIIYTLSQLGLVLYMFVVGMEFDTRLMRRNAGAAASISLAGLLTPLLLGVGAAAFLLSRRGEFFTGRVSFVQASVFMGAAIATTAFPMLARIISERGIAGSRMGTMVLTSGAVTDAVSWILLATVVAVFHSDPHVALLALVGGGLYLVLMVTGGKRLLEKIYARAGSDDPRAKGTPSTLIVTLVLVLAAGWYTNAVGIHSIFGGFVLGIVMPRGVVDQLTQWIEPMVKNLLLPLFFVYSGLNTHIGLLNTPYLWAVTIGIFAISVLGKGVACYGAARLNGMRHYEAVAVGGLMNARGLIELILLNIGLQAGLITPTLFAVLVLMAIVTTLTAGPIFDYAAARGGALELDEHEPSSPPPASHPVPVAAGAGTEI
jgi:Kef-type K+ transport system membrane component KefB